MEYEEVTMIDIQDIIFDEISRELEVEFSDCYVSPYAVRVPPKIPCVAIEEIGNYTYTRTSDSGDDENHAQITFEFNVYTKGANKLNDGKKLIQLVDSKMKELGFRRGMYNPITFIEDDVLYRQIVRYSAIISKVDPTDDKIRIYRR